MDRKELLDTHKEMCQKARTIMVVKNHDYAADNDPFKNFRAASFLDVDPGIGLLLRVLDKLARLHTYWQTRELRAESVDDAELDIINYMVLHRGLRGSTQCRFRISKFTQRPCQPESKRVRGVS
jgi:hypothetical protein